MHIPQKLTAVLRAIVIVLTLAIIAFLSFLGWIGISKADLPAEMEIFRGEALAISPDTLTVTSWNIGYGGLGSKMDFFYDGGQMVRPEPAYFDSCVTGIKSYISEDLQTDIFLFQEVDTLASRSWQHSLKSELEGAHPAFSSFFALNYDAAFVPMPLTNPMGMVHSGLLALSSYQPAEVVRYALPGEYSWPTRLFMLNRCFMLMRYKLLNGKELVVINTHNSAFDEGGEQRLLQIEFIRKLLLKEYKKRNYIIAGGDWNQSPEGFNPAGIANGDQSVSISPVFPDSLLKGWVRAFDPDIPSNRYVNEPYLRGRTQTTVIDFLLLSPNIKLISVRTEDLGFLWSDHQPVSVRVILGHAE